MARLRQHASDAAYIDETYQLSAVGTKTLVRDSATQFTIQSCDATAHFTANRRIRVVGATTDHGYVVLSVYSAPDTIVTVTMESGNVPTSPTQALVHVDPKIRSGAFSMQGAGNGLDADKLDGYQAADIFGPAIFADAIVNGGFEVWQRGTASVSCPAGSRTFLADRWFVQPSGAACTQERTTTTPTGAISKYALKITGATSVTQCDFACQRIESILIPYIKTTITVSALIKNETGANLAAALFLNTADALDDFTSVTNRYTNAFASITNGSSQRVSLTMDVSGYTNIDNGLEVRIVAGGTSMDSASKSITITEVQIDRSTTFSHFRYRPFPLELLRCQRFYAKTFAYGTVPAQNWVGGSGLAAGSITISGGSASPGFDYTAASWVLPTFMRATPTVTTYNPHAANAKARSITSSAERDITSVPSTSTIGFTINPAGEDRSFCFGATASSEL